MLKSTYNNIKGNSFKYFFLKLCILFAIILVLDFSIGSILRYLYYKQESGMQFRTTYSIEKTMADVLVFGSSRANHHYNNTVFENRFTGSNYNVGRDGTSIFYHYAILSCVLKRYRPKIIVLDFNGSEFNKTQLNYDKISLLLPYYREHDEIRSIIELKSNLEEFKMLSYIYPYNSSIFSIAIGNIELNKQRWKDLNGYLPLNKIWNGSPHGNTNTFKYEVDINIVKFYESFIKDCIKSNLKLYIVCSPYLIKSNYLTCSVELGKEIAKRNNVLFFDFSEESIFINNRKYFADIMHLNDKGAIIFSNMLLDSISRASEKRSMDYIDP